MKILSFGEILWDVYDSEAHIGGAPLNFGAHLGKMGQEVYMLSALGEDDLGKLAESYLDSFGVSRDFIGISRTKDTGRCLVTLDKNGMPFYNLLDDVAYDFIDTDKVKGHFDVLYFGTLALRHDHNKASLEALIKRVNFGDIFVDLNIRSPYYSKESVTFATEKATILKVSLEELDTVASLLEIDGGDYKAFARQLARGYRGLKCIIITLGSEGAFALDTSSDKEYSCDSVKVEVKSTVGAGDSFSAAFLHKYLKGNDIQSCLDLASRVAGFVVSRYEAIPDYKIEDFN